MKRFLIVLLSCFGLTSCTSHTEPGIEGYIVKRDESRILVVASNPKDFSSTGGLSEFYNAIWFSNAPRKGKVGDKVQVWFDVVAESYPGQSQAEKVKILPRKKPKNADLTEDEAIRKALAADVINKHEIPGIKTVKFDDKSSNWEILIKQGEAEINVKIADQK